MLELSFSQHRTTATRGASFLASAVSSFSILYKHWKEGKLSRNILKDFVLGEDPEQFFKPRSDGAFTEDGGPVCTMECWPPVSCSPGYDIGMRTSRKCSEISHTTNYKRTLVPSEPRRASDANGRRALLLIGGDESEGC